MTTSKLAGEVIDNPHDYPGTGFPYKGIPLSNKPLSYWKNILKPIRKESRKIYFLWKFRQLCEFENIPNTRIGGEDGTQIFQYLRLLIIPRVTGIDGDGI